MSETLLLPKGRATGRKERSFDPMVAHYSSERLKRQVRGIPLPAVPTNLCWFDGMPKELGPMCNGPDPANPDVPVVGCCTIAGAGHATQVWTFNGKRQMYSRTDAAIIAGYERYCGYKLGDPNTDQGGNEQDVLKGWMNDGMPDNDGTLRKLRGFIEIDPRNPADIRRCIAECGVVYFGANIPEGWDEINEGDVWDIQGPATGGHCFIGAGFDADHVIMNSWGFQVPTTNRAITQYVDEAYALFSDDWIAATGRNPFNMTDDDMESTLQPLRMAA